ncbi:MAG: hypothetical protein P8N59_02600 [Planktomarina sp.]|nr:hypothetical protein [Planktomarina sp.]
MNAYILEDQASRLKFRNKGNISLLFVDDPALFNQYAYLPANPERQSMSKRKRYGPWKIG